MIIPKLYYINNEIDRLTHLRNNKINGDDRFVDQEIFLIIFKNGKFLFFKETETRHSIYNFRDKEIYFPKRVTKKIFLGSWRKKMVFAVDCSEVEINMPKE